MVMALLLLLTERVQWVASVAGQRTHSESQSERRHVEPTLPINLSYFSAYIHHQENQRRNLCY